MQSGQENLRGTSPPVSDLLGPLFKLSSIDDKSVDDPKNFPRDTGKYIGMVPYIRGQGNLPRNKDGRVGFP